MVWGYKLYLKKAIKKKNRLLINRKMETLILQCYNTGKISLSACEQQDSIIRIVLKYDHQLPQFSFVGYSKSTKLPKPPDPTDLLPAFSSLNYFSSFKFHPKCYMVSYHPATSSKPPVQCSVIVRNSARLSLY